MINRFRKYWEILVIFFFSLTPLLWFKGSEIIIGHDSGFRLNYLDHLRNLFFSWNPVQNFGTDWGILKGFLVIQAPETFFSLLFGSLQAGEKISFVLWFLVIGLSMYVFVKSFFPQREFWIFRIFSSLFYMFNFFLLQGWFIAERAKFSLFAALPLTVLLLFKTFSRDYSLLKGSILFSLVTFFLNGGGSPPLFGSLLLLFAITFVFLTVVNVVEKGAKELVYSAKVLISFTVGSLAINAYFVFPHLYQIFNKYSGVLSSIGGIEGILAWESAINKFASFTNLFRLQGIPDWYDNPNHPYSYLFNENPILIALSFVFILVICVGLFSYRKADHSREENRLVVLFFTIFMIALIFAAGSHDPLGSLYIFLVKHIPGFAIFRSAFYKFGPTFWFAAIFLTGYFVNILIDRYIKNKAGRIFVGLAVIAFVVVYHFPYFTTNFFQFSRPFTTKVSVPPYVYDTTAYLNSKESGRILLLPKLDPVYNVDSYVWGFWSLESLPKLSLNSSVIANDNVSPLVVNKLYEAIDQNSEASFMKLAGILGVDRVLWRDDVMYSDRKTTSDILIFEKNNILGFSGVSLEKQFGEWEIYKIDSELHLPTFYSSGRLVYANSNPDQFLNLTEKEGNNTTTVVFAGDMDISQPFLSDLANKKYIQPSCVLCKTKESEAVKNGIDIPSARLLPSSMFYFLKTLREDRLLDKYKNFPAQRIDVDLAFSGMRIAEVASMVFKNDLNVERKKGLVSKNVARYKHSIDDALEQAALLPDQDRNNYLIKTLGYTQVHRDFMDRLRYRQGFSEDTYEDMVKFLSKTISLVEGEIWASDDNNKRFIFSIDKEGIYNIEFANNEALPKTIMLDGSSLGKTQGIPLTEGQHRLQLQYAQGDDPIFQDNSEFTLGNNEEKVVALNNPSQVDRYVLSFEYKLNQGDNAIHELYLGNTKKARFDLSRHAEWKTISQELTLSSNPEENVRAKIINLSKESNETAFRSFAITRLTVPSIFISQENSAGGSVPEVTFRQENPTKYTVSVKGVTEPYFLILNQGFDRGWKLYDKEDVGSILSTFFSKPIDKINHFKSNSYGNGWYLEETGDREYLVIFEPQKMFYIGLIVSILFLVGVGLVYVYKIR